MRHTLLHMRQIAKLLNLEPGPLNLQVSSHYVQMLSAVMGAGAHSHQFCFALHFKMWNELFVGDMGGVEKEESFVQDKE